MMARVFFIMALAIALATSLARAVTPAEEEERLTTASSFNDPQSSEEGSPSIRAMSQYSSGQNHPKPPSGPKTCDKYPRLCLAAGSTGPDCCGKKCVNVDTDKHNCGKCGCRCKYGQICCGGKCVDVMCDPNNCGKCNNKCKKGVLCKYGMCDYAN